MAVQSKAKRAAKQRSGPRLSPNARAERERERTERRLAASRARRAETHARWAELDAAWRAEIERVRKPGFEVGAPERALHGAWREDVEIVGRAPQRGQRATTEPGRVVGRRRRYGADLDRVPMPDDLRPAARHFARLAAEAERLGNLKSCLADGSRSANADPDAARRKVVAAARVFAGMIALLATRHVVGGVTLSEADILRRVLCEGVALSRVHGGEKRLGGKAYAAARAAFEAGLRQVKESKYFE